MASFIAASSQNRFHAGTPQAVVASIGSAITNFMQYCTAWNGHVVHIFPTELGTITGCNPFETRAQLLASKWRAVDHRSFYRAATRHCKPASGNKPAAISQTSGVSSSSTAHARASGISNESVVLRYLRAKAEASASILASVNPAPESVWWRRGVMDGEPEVGCGTVTQTWHPSMGPGPYVIGGQPDALAFVKPNRDISGAAAAAAVAVATPICIPVEIKTRMSPRSMGVHPKERLQLQAYIHAMNAPWGLHVQNVLNTKHLIETVIDRDDVHWNTVVVPAVEAFVCDIRRLIHGTDADANQELVKEVLAAAREVWRETTAGTAEVPAVAAEVSAVAPAVAPAVTTLLHDLRIVLRGRGLAPAGGSIALKQQLQLVRQSPTTNIIRVHAMDGGGECVGTLNRALSCHLAPLLDAGFASGDTFAATATVIGMPPPDSAAAATKPALLSVTLRGSLTLLPEVGKFVTALASVASAAAAVAAAAAAAGPTGTPAAAAVSDTAAAAASTAASTAADATAAVTTKKRKSPPVDPVVLDLLRKYGGVLPSMFSRKRKNPALPLVHIPGVPTVCTRSYRKRLCK